MGQGKKWSQMKDSETFAFIALVAIGIMIVLCIVIGISSCNATAQKEPIPDDDRIWIHMSDGDSLELVSDEYGNQYLKQYTKWPHHVYIPYPGDTEEPDTLKFFNAKNQ